MDLNEIIQIGKDIIALLLSRDFDRQEIDYILRRAVETNEDEWIREDEDE